MMYDSLSRGFMTMDLLERVNHYKGFKYIPVGTSALQNPQLLCLKACDNDPSRGASDRNGRSRHSEPFWAKLYR